MAVGSAVATVGAVGMRVAEVRGAVAAGLEAEVEGKEAKVAD